MKQLLENWNRYLNEGFPSYYDIDDHHNPPPIETLLKRWVDDDAKIYDDNVNDRTPAWYDPKELTPYREWTRHALRNPPHTEAYKKLKQDIIDNGIREPIIMKMGRNGVAVIGEGNHRHEIALELGLDKVPVRFVWYDKATNKGKRAPRKTSPEIEDLLKRSRRKRLMKDLIDSEGK